MMMSAPPVTPPEDRLASASDATLMPTGALKVTAPRTGYITEAASVAAAVASLALDSKCTPRSERISCASDSTSIRCEIGAPW